ncbi:MAG: hypothetical protein ACLQFR_21450 [Streptosporangiaceae bacterium]
MPAGPAGRPDCPACLLGAISPVPVRLLPTREGTPAEASRECGFTRSRPARLVTMKGGIMASQMSTPDPADRARDTLGGPDPGAGEDELGGPDIDADTDELGGPDLGTDVDELGGADPLQDTDELGGTDPGGWEDELG